MLEYAMSVDGKAVEGMETVPVINPATEEPFARVPACSRAQLDDAMEAARRAFPDWRRDGQRRRDVLLALATQLADRADELGPLLTQEQGRPVAQAANEFRHAAIWCQYIAGLELPVETVQDDEFRLAQVRHVPYGVVAAITPWNYPVLLAVWKAAPALLAGNTVVMKPSPFTPVTTLILGEILRDLVPPGVFNVVSGGDAVGEWMTTHPVPRKVSFTGSVETGKQVAVAAGADLKRVTLELGGNDPAILLPGIDPGTVAGSIFWCAFINSGQACNAIKRVYVHDSQYAEVVDAIAAIAAAVKVGDGMDDTSVLGPLNNPAQLERVTALVDDARGQGARVVTGGGRLATRGYFYAPTIVSDITDGTRLVDEEQFGPVLPIIPYDKVGDAVARANATNYGLCASVWSADADRAIEVGDELECGNVWVNQHLAMAPNLPFGGFKWSGMGVENGPWGLLESTQIQVLNVAR